MNATPTDVERETVRMALLAIVERNNGVLNPRLVIDAARDPGHVLHPHFEWDDAVAGEAYRLAQVGALVRRVRLTIVKAGTKPREVTLSTTREYQSRPSMRRASGGYESIDTILADTDKRAELIAQVVRELSAYRKRYAELSELQSVWFAVDEVTTDLFTDLSPSAPGGDDTRPGAAG
jgi:hypothetical protein